MNPTKLNLASGRLYLEGYINVDDGSMNPKEKVDLKADILTLKFRENRFEEIFLCHFVMYLVPEDALVLIKRWRSWLKDKGELIIETSDAKMIAQMILDDDRNIGQMFGYGDTKGHKWSYTPKTLRKLLKEAGFKKTVMSRGGLHNRPDRDFTIIATK